jgi:hypothetical protein
MDEKYENLETACPNCKLIFRIKDMKLDAGSNRLLCINCFNNPGAKIVRIK